MTPSTDIELEDLSESEEAAPSDPSPELLSLEILNQYS